MIQPRGQPSELYLLLIMEAQVVSYLRPLTFYQNLDLDFRIGMDLRAHLLQPSVFGPGGCDCHYFKSEASDTQAGGPVRCPR